MTEPWNEKWKIVRELAPGGQGQTFLVENKVKGDQRGVLKIMHPQYSQDLPSRTRILQEATSLFSVSSGNGLVPNVLDTNASVETAKDLICPLYLVMDFVDGETLHDIIHRAMLPVDKAVAVALDLC